MYSRKPQTILTSRRSNSTNKDVNKTSMRELHFTSPAEDHYGTVYVNIGGVAMPIR